ncbi:dTDP-4-dehydrorhamnose 3,5-epimerase [Nitrospira sp. T9]|uniref:dTDP-4-dehydrorhamnose 3,5-epimerase n=1 Tax=unclassified Nitrospira TaxID=2652172 RepID=UPI003F96FF52
MNIIKTAIPGLVVVEPRVFEDPRGFFMETFHGNRYSSAGLPAVFVQDNFSHSCRGVLRGLHYQLHQPQGKLVHVIRGEIFDVAVDIRKGSPWFGQWVGETLSGSNKRQLFIPPGFAHGFCVLSESADFLYKCTDYYAPEHEHGLHWNDPDIGIVWPKMDFMLSEKDEQSPRLKDLGDSLPGYDSKQ